jgi:poly(glycerol-phosphate) alpha-glucosyltransferase
MDVTVLTPSLSRNAGGIFEVERRLSQSLSERSEVTVQVVGLQDDATAEDLPAWKPLEPTTVSTWGPDAFGYAPSLPSALAATDADLLHLHALWMYTSIAARGWSRAFDRPYVVSPHGMLDPWALANSRWKKKLMGALYENTSLRTAACLHALNEAEYEAIRNYGLNTPVCIIPNGVDVPEAPELQADETPPWNGQISESAKVLLFLGRIHPKKGLSELIDAWSQLDPAGWHLAIIGWDDGGHEAALRSTIVSAGLQDEVHLLGPRFGAEKEAAFAHADGFVLPSHSEGLPMTVLEAWSYRTPVLMTPQCNLPEGFEHDAALRIEPTPKRIAAGIDCFFSMSASDRSALGNAGRELVERQYTWPRVAERMHAVYRWILNEEPVPDCVRLD